MTFKAEWAYLLRPFVLIEIVVGTLNWLSYRQSHHNHITIYPSCGVNNAGMWLKTTRYINLSKSGQFIYGRFILSKLVPNGDDIINKHSFNSS